MDACFPAGLTICDFSPNFTGPDMQNFSVFGVSRCVKAIRREGSKSILPI